MKKPKVHFRRMYGNGATCCGLTSRCMVGWGCSKKVTCKTCRRISWKARSEARGDK